MLRADFVLIVQDDHTKKKKNITTAAQCNQTKLISIIPEKRTIKQEIRPSTTK
jgi:hypothetical protein